MAWRLLSRRPMDSLSGMGVFVQVADARSLSVAARQLGVTPSAISKTLTKLEARLGVRLLHRTTRQVGLTEDGHGFLERCRRVLHEVKEAEAAMAHSRSEPSGRVRLACPAGAFLRWFSPKLPGLLERYPLLGLDLTLRETAVETMTDGVDVAVGWSPLLESTPNQRRLASWKLRAVAAPAYLARRGTPKTLEAVAGHDGLPLLSERRAAEWRFKRGGQVVAVAVPGRVASGSLEMIRELALAGGGLARLPEGMIADDLKQGALVAVLDEWSCEDLSLVAALPSGDQGSPRVRATVDWLEMCLASRRTASRA